MNLDPIEDNPKHPRCPFLPFPSQRVPFRRSNAFPSLFLLPFSYPRSFARQIIPRNSPRYRIPLRSRKWRVAANAFHANAIQCTTIFANNDRNVEQRTGYKLPLPLSKILHTTRRTSCNAIFYNIFYNSSSRISNKAIFIVRFYPRCSSNISNVSKES